MQTIGESLSGTRSQTLLAFMFDVCMGGWGGGFVVCMGVQVESHLARVHGGSGLGLVLCKGIVEGMGGSLTFSRSVEDAP